MTNFDGASFLYEIVHFTRDEDLVFAKNKNSREIHAAVSKI